jgi:hypothetical protein
VVVELTAVVALEGTNRAAELGGYPGKEVCESGESVRLQSQGKSPNKMGIIVQNHQIVFVSRKTDYRGGPKITMNQVKSLLSPRRRSRKRETSMSA